MEGLLKKILATDGLEDTALAAREAADRGWRAPGHGGLERGSVKRR
jgi:hypothetical protein